MSAPAHTDAVREAVAAAFRRAVSEQESELGDLPLRERNAVHAIMWAGIDAAVAAAQANTALGLPPLPTPADTLESWDGKPLKDWYSAEQMHAFALPTIGAGGDYPTLRAWVDATIQPPPADAYKAWFAEWELTLPQDARVAFPK